MNAQRLGSAVTIVLAILVGTAAAALAIHGPILQPASYHDFADTRALGPLPNWQNVLSNLVFLVTGVLGALLYARRPAIDASPAWLYVFVGAIGVAFGSAWYHLAPSDEALVWDRIPMGVAFTAYLVALLQEYVDERITPAWLLVLVPLAVASVFYWHATGDLRGWILVQGLPILATPVVLLLSKARRAGRHYLWIGAACYVLAKIAEVADAAIYESTFHVVSGHAAKHLFAGAGVLCFWRMLVARRAHQPASPAAAPSHSIMRSTP